MVETLVPVLNYRPPLWVLVVVGWFLGLIVLAGFELLGSGLTRLAFEHGLLERAYRGARAQPERPMIPRAPGGGAAMIVEAAHDPACSMARSSPTRAKPRSGQTYSASPWSTGALIRIRITRSCSA